MTPVAIDLPAPATGADFWYPRGAVVPRVRPLDTFLFKIASRCNLACPYCYVYELRDQSWRSQPSFMSEATMEVALERIRDHVVAHSIPVVSVIFHGGEPLLVGPRRLDRFAEMARDKLSDVAELQLGAQTNGTLFNTSFIELARRHGMRFGLSVDGPAHHQDRVRIHPNGRGSSDLVERAAILLRENPDAFGGILCVISLDIQPAEVWDYLSQLRPKSVDLLLPLATYDHLPPVANPLSEVARYGEWLVAFLELWYRAGDDRPDVRYFSSIMRMLLGRPSLVESIGVNITSLIVIESNGDLEAVDSLKACYQGAASTGLNVMRNAFDDAFDHPAIVSRQMGAASLSSACRDCAFLNVCGGGYQPHRYSSARGFQNPTIYCEALQMLISRTAALMSAEFAELQMPIPPLVKALANASCRHQAV